MIKSTVIKRHQYLSVKFDEAKASRPAVFKFGLDLGIYYGCI